MSKWIRTKDKRMMMLFALGEKWRKQMKKLKSCPFCGNENVICVKSFVGVYLIKCLKCNASVTFVHKDEERETIEAWNRRAGINIDNDLLIERIEAGLGLEPIEGGEPV